MTDQDTPVTEPSVPPDPSPTAEEIDAYRARGWILPLCGVMACILFSLLAPLWYDLWAGHAKPLVLVIVGILPSILAIFFHIRGSKRRQNGTPWYLWSILLNTVGTSLCMAAYYVFLETKPTATPLLAGALLSMGIYVLMAFLMKLWPHRYPLLTALVALLTVCLMVVSVVFWIKNDNKVFSSFVFFNLLWTLISVCALHVACSDETAPALRFASFASFGILLGVAAIVLVILACAAGDCDCDCGDGCCDCGDCGCDGKRKKKGGATAVDIHIKNEFEKEIAAAATIAVQKKAGKKKKKGDHTPDV